MSLRLIDASLEVLTLSVASPRQTDHRRPREAIPASSTTTLTPGHTASSIFRARPHIRRLPTIPPHVRGRLLCQNATDYGGSRGPPEYVPALYGFVADVIKLLQAKYSIMAPSHRARISRCSSLSSSTRNALERRRLFAYVLIHTVPMTLRVYVLPAKIGINYVGQTGELRGCHNDARNVMQFLCSALHIFLAAVSKTTVCHRSLWLQAGRYRDFARH